MRQLVYSVLPFLILTLPLGAQDYHSIDHDLWNGQFDSSLELIEHALLSTNDSLRVFELKNKKAEALIRSGKFKEAEETLTALNKSISDDHRAGLWNTTTGFLNLSRGRNDLAVQHLTEALNHFEKAGKLGQLDAAQTQTFLGNLYVVTGKYEQAEEQLSVALLTRQRFLPDTHELIAASLNDLGLLYSFTDTDKALGYYEKALAIYEKLHGKTDAKIAIATTNIGYLYSKLELYGDAVANFEQALSIWNKIHPGPYPAKAFILVSLGQVSEKRKNHGEAREYYKKAELEYQKSYSGKHPDIARVYNALGNLEQSEGNYESSLQYYQKAIVTNHPSFDSMDVSSNPSATEYYDGNILLYSLLNKAQALELDFFRRTLRFKELSLAIETLQICDTLINNLRQQIHNESDKITLGGIADEVYADGVRICVEASDVVWSKKKYLEQAFLFSEKSKAAVLLGAISDVNAKSYAGIPSALLEEEKELRASVALMSQQLAQRPEESEEKYLRQLLYELNRRSEAFEDRLEKEFPTYYNLKYNSSSPTISQLTSMLEPSSAIASYFIDEKNDRLYIFKLLKKGLRLEQHQLPDEFERNVIGLRNGLYFSELQTFYKASSYLSPLLIPSLPSYVSDLVIIPTARVTRIPFETLFTGKADETAGFKDLPYVAKRFSVRYEFSSALIWQKKKRTPQLSPSILLCAPVTFSHKAGFQDLPATESEVDEISKLFSSRNYETELLVRDRADEASIKKEDLKRFSFLHFATHGVVDETDPELSRIELSHSDGSEDGILYAGEIYNLQLQANLVTLSACQTGLGRISKGEGVIGLSRALIYAGARNCMVSLWEVADESTAEFMKDYYALLLNDSQSNYTTTLQRAKLKMMRNEKYSAPYYWAPFILIGF